MGDTVRVRYAPSPTGYQHIGGVRTALYNYFFAKSNGGKFILRVEDTDRERFAPDYQQDIFDSLAFLGVVPDEGPGFGGECGPYIQSERVSIYREYAENLVKAGKAYYCFCTSERLEQLKKQQEQSKSSSQGYDRKCSALSPDEAAARIAAGESHVIRLRIPTEGSTSFDDEILGRITRKNKDITPDPIILKSDGFPTYHLANVIDDHLMGITHIMRAQEWLPSVPLHIMLYDAFGWQPPKFCHLPMVMGKDGQKLSKRHGSTSLRQFISEGYLKESIINYVTLVGWAYDGEREVFSKQELEKVFDMSKIHPSPAVFDYKKLDWFNGMYIREKSDAELVDLLRPHFNEQGLVVGDDGITRIIPLVKERLKKLSDAPAMVRFLFENVTYHDKKDFAAKGDGLDVAIHYLKQALPLFENAKTDDDIDAIEERLQEISKADGVKANSVFMPLRTAITASPVSPPLFASIRLLGVDKAVSRIKAAIAFLES